MENLMGGKKGIILGVANSHSILFGIAEKLVAQGAEIALTYPNEAILERQKKLAESLQNPLLIPCDVEKEEDIKNAFQTVAQKMGKIDFIVHGIAFSDRNELKGPFYETSKENFLKTMHISCYSLIEIIKNALPFLNENASILALTYLGGQKYIPNYNVMGLAKAALEMAVKYLAFDLGDKGIRVNALSSGPIRTLASSGISNFSFMQEWATLNSALLRPITPLSIGNAALFYLSDLSLNITASCQFIDSGYSQNAMINPKKIKESIEVLKKML